jgi:hypothetical protein
LQDYVRRRRGQVKSHQPARDKWLPDWHWSLPQGGGA